MGAKLVTLALARWTHVSDRAFRVLVRMALTALDEGAHGTPAGLYFGGRDLLALTLRNESHAHMDVLYRTVRKAVAELVAAGAIERTNFARAGANQVYRMRLDGPRSIDQLPLDALVNSPIQEVPSGPPEEVHQRPPQGVPSGSSRRSPTDPPRNQEEPVEELYEERYGVDLPANLPLTREHDAESDPTNSPLPAVCEHRLSSRLRPDGKPSCVFCRRGLSAEPDLAEVIPIRSAS